MLAQMMALSGKVMQVYKSHDFTHGLNTDQSCIQRDTHRLPSEPESTGKDTKHFPLPPSLSLSFF